MPGSIIMSSLIIRIDVFLRYALWTDMVRRSMVDAM